VFFPALLSRFTSNRFSVSSWQFFGSYFSTLDSTLPPCIYLGRVFPAIGVWRGNLLGRYVNDELGKLVSIAGSLSFADGHKTIMPQAGRLALRPVDFKL
jgi:hypothetical protein